LTVDETRNREARAEPQNSPAGTGLDKLRKPCGRRDDETQIGLMTRAVTAMNRVLKPVPKLQRRAADPGKK